MAQVILPSAALIDECGTPPIRFPFEDDPPSEADRHHWAAESPDHHASVPVPGEPLLPWPEWLAVQASFYRSFDSDAADFVARLLDRAASTARFLDATSPEEHEAREEVWDRWAREREGVAS